MMQAIIDIGSNSVRLAIFSGGNIILRDKSTAKLGQGFYQTQVIEKSAIERNLDAVNRLIAACLDKGVKRESIFIFATATVRDAKNGQDFCNLVKAQTGITVDVLSEEIEAKCALLGALNGGDGSVADLGGGSVELITSKNGKIEFSHSINMGVVKLTDMFGNDRSGLEAYVRERLMEYGAPRVSALIGVGGSATCCAYMLSGDEKYDLDKNHGRVADKKRLYALVDKLYTLTPEQRTQIYDIGIKRAQTIHVGAVVLALLLDYLGLDSYTASERDNLDGYYTLKVDKK